MTTDYVERLRRSVSSWERLHAVIIGFALTSAVKAFDDTWPQHAGLAILTYSQFHLLIAFVVTLVPFFHGAQRHIETVHLSADVKQRPGLVFFDYLMLFLEGVFFSLLGMAVGNDRLFVQLLIWLMAVDLLWAGTSYVALNRHSVMRPWIILDIVSLALLGLMLCEMPAGLWSVALAYGAVIRTTVDYVWNWKFYLDLKEQKRGPKRIAIESPFRGDQAANTVFVQNVCKWVSNEGNSPYAMHLFFPRFLNDTIEKERQQGINGGLAWVALADEVWFCLPSESETPVLSDGMKEALKSIKDLSPPPVRKYFTFSQEGKRVAQLESAQFEKA